MTTNLWGDLKNVAIPKTPASILKEQAAYLTKTMSAILTGEVSSSVQYGVFQYSLNIVAPALNNYSYTAVKIFHGIELYSVTVSADLNDEMECRDEKEFTAALASALTSPRVKNAIASLLAQSIR